MLHIACMKENTSPQISTDFEGKFVLEELNTSSMTEVYILHQNGLTPVPIIDTIGYSNNDWTWIRNGQFIQYLESQVCWCPAHGIPQIIHPDGSLVRDFKSDFGTVIEAVISPDGDYMALTKNSNVYI